MSEMVLLSDIHLGRFKYGKMNSTGIDARTQDILDNIQQALDYTFKNNIKTVVILGDFYHTKRPAQIFRRLLTAKLELALDKGVKLYLLLGNHDQGKTHAHDLVELVELSSQIHNLEVIEVPKIIEQDDSLLCFLPHVNIFDLNISVDEFHNYNIQKIKEMAEEVKKRKKKFNYFFGHFGTDKSFVGKSFDMGSDEKCSRVLPLDIFDPLVWTEVYLGDIHKPQELNDFCRHVGSIAKVDFGEEGEKKGFYYVNGKLDKFIEIKDREMKTLTVDLVTGNARDKMGDFCESIQELDLSQAIVRIRVIIKEEDKKLIDFTGIEDYLKEVCWNYVGKNLQEVREQKQEISLETNGELNYISLFRDYISKINLDDKEEVEKSGEKILLDIQQ
jgi:DNA repair protein SbcD/Mre11